MNELHRLILSPLDESSIHHKSLKINVYLRPSAVPLFEM
jgi:hypothetical protein